MLLLSSSHCRGGILRYSFFSTFVLCFSCCSDSTPSRTNIKRAQRSLRFALIFEPGSKQLSLIEKLFVVNKIFLVFSILLSQIFSTFCRSFTLSSSHTRAFCVLMFFQIKKSLARDSLELLHRSLQILHQNFHITPNVY